MPNLHELHPPRIIRNEELLDIKTLFSPTNEVLWAKLLEMQSTLELLSGYHQGAQPQSLEKRVLDQCWANLLAARKCIERRAKWNRKFLENYTLYWQLLHRIEADLLLILPLSELVSHAAEVLADFGRNMKDPIDVKIWMGASNPSATSSGVKDHRDWSAREGSVSALLNVAVSKLVETAATEPNPDSREGRSQLFLERNVVRHALELVNQQSVWWFQQLNFTILIRAWSGLFLLIFGVGTWLFYWKFLLDPEARADHIQWALDVLVVLLGTTGAIVSNILSKEPRLATLGPTRRHILYVLFLRLAMGAFAAYFLYLIARTGFFSGLPVIDEHQVTLSTKELCVYAVIAIAAGYAGEKIISKFMNDILERLYKLASKKEDEASSTEERNRKAA